MIDRRHFVAGAFGGFALAATGGRSIAAEAGGRVGHGPLVADSAGFLDLPAGFAYRVVSQFGDRMDDGLWVPDRADGMGCVPLDAGRFALVRNHELQPGHVERGAHRGAPDRAAAFDRLPDGRALPGGTTTMILDARSGQLLSQYLSLAGTIRNCGGGTTPWGSWLTCEEDLTRAGRAGARDHGWVFEVPAAARAPIDPVPLTAMGRFNHEAAAVDPRTGIVYLTEDRPDGLLYRFLPAARGRLAAGGRLQAMALVDPAVTDGRNWSRPTIAVGQSLPVRWIDLDGTDSPDDDLRHRGHARGALLFARGEGIHAGNGEFYVCCTSGGPAGLGQVMRYRPSRHEGQDGERDAPGILRLFVESPNRASLDFGDNLTVAPNGHLVICEDQYTDVVANRLIGVDPRGRTYVLGALHAQTELAGACFAPDGRTLFVNAYSPARTLAITGPWGTVRG